MKISFITPASSYQGIVSSIQLLLEEYCFIIPVSISEKLLTFFSGGKVRGEMSGGNVLDPVKIGSQGAEFRWQVIPNGAVTDMARGYLSFHFSRSESPSYIRS